MGRKGSKSCKVGVFVCHCGTNIANTVDVKEVAEFARKLPGVVMSKDHTFMCSEEGQALIKEAIRNKKLDRVVVASCSPKLHEPTFRRVVSEAGQNPFFLEMANLREDVSWVHYDDAKKATKKAESLVKAAVERAKKLDAVGEKTVPVEQAVLIIGGGIAGIQAALDTAELGIKTYMVEKSPSIGGNMARLVKTFPTGDCALCILSPKMAEVAANPNIEMLAYSEVKEVEGFIGNFKVKVVKKARFVDEKACIGCGVCADKCPVEVPNEWDLNLGTRKAIYTQFPQAIPNTYTIDQKNCLKLTKKKCGLCEKACPSDAIRFKQKPEEIEIKVGTIIVATGAREYDPSAVKPYSYAENEDIITQLQLARMLDPSGPTQGKVIRPSDGKEPEKYLMVQCVGSRDVNYNVYCSRVCCMAAIKHAMMIRQEQNPNAEIFIYYLDMRCFGKGYEEYYKRAMEEGIRFIRSRIANIQVDKDMGAIIEDADLNEVVTIKPDLIVLSTGLVPNEDAEELAKTLRLSLDANNFFSERHPKLAPVDTNTDGIYICGCTQGPKDIPDTVAQARAAAVAAATPILKREITIDLAKAEVNTELCDGCGTCVKLCPYHAIQMKEGTKPVAEVIEMICKSCGTCAAGCPTGALQLRHYKLDQMFAQIEGVCGGK